MRDYIDELGRRRIASSQAGLRIVLATFPSEKLCLGFERKLVDTKLVTRPGKY